MSTGQIIVTGASKGIGAAIAVELDHRGYTVACVSRSGKSPVGYALSCDMTDETRVREVVAEIAERGPIVGQQRGSAYSRADS